MVREIFPNIFQLKVPLPGNPLRHLNSYLLKSETEKLLIDTGMNLPQSFEQLSEGLAKTGTEIGELTGILLTHFHVDHVGLIPPLRRASDDIRLLIHHIEAELSKAMAEGFESYKDDIEGFLEANGAPVSIARNLHRYHPAFFAPEAYQQLAEIAVPLEDGQSISVGEYHFRVLWTPGHSPGHVCLYEPQVKILISGDHLLPTITPHVSQYMEAMDPLSDYLKSLEKVEKLDIETVLPAHEDIFLNHRERVGQLHEHHQERLAEVMRELGAGRATAYALASRVHWDINYRSWDEFPFFQRYFALGETLAHLNLLEQKQLVEKTVINHIVFYQRAEKRND